MSEAANGITALVLASVALAGAHHGLDRGTRDHSVRAPADPTTACHGTAAVMRSAHLAQELSIVEFDGADDVSWTVVNDGVMGGRSSGSIRVREDGTGVFEGTVSLQNNGGFASVRALTEPRDLSSFRSLRLRIRGDGRTYQVRLRSNRRLDGIAYRAEFGTSGEGWEGVEIPFEAFEPTFRGRVLPGVHELDTSALRQVGLMIADSRAGDFRLEIDWIRAVPGGAVVLAYEFWMQESGGDLDIVGQHPTRARPDEIMSTGTHRQGHLAESTSPRSTS